MARPKKTTEVPEKLPIEKYHVTVTLITPMLGTVPKDEHIYSTYIASKAPEDVDTSDEDVPVSDEKRYTGFHTDEKGIYLLDYQVKGMIKEGGNILKDVFGITALRSKLDNFLFVQPRKIYLGKKEPDGVLERPLRAQTAMGPRVSLAKSDYVDEGTTFEFDIAILSGPVTIDVVRVILDYGELKGFGQFRNGGFGRFSYNIS